jgi:lactoylglutathione lyase
MPVSDVFTSGRVAHVRNPSNRGILGNSGQKSMTARPFKILGIQQVAVGAPDKAALRRLWVETLGLTPHGQFTSEKENVEEDIVTMGAGAFTVEVDLMQPIDPDRKPRVDTPPLNHIGLWVDDIEAAVQWLGDRGVRFTPGGIRPGAAGHRVCFIHPKGNETAPIGGEGVLIELVEAPAHVRDAFEEISRASKQA